MNDDMFLNKEIPKNYYFEKDKIHLHMSKAYKAPMPDRMRSSNWHSSVGYSNSILSKLFIVYFFLAIIILIFLKSSIDMLRIIVTL